MEEYSIGEVPEIILKLNKFNSKLTGIFIEYMYSYIISSKLDIVCKNFLTYKKIYEVYTNYIYKRLHIEYQFPPNELYVKKIKISPIFYSLVSIPYHFDKVINKIDEKIFIDYADFVLSNITEIETLIPYLIKALPSFSTADFSVEIKNDKVHGIIDMIVDNMIIDIKVTKKLDLNKYFKQLMTYYENYPNTQGVMIINFLLGKVVFWKSSVVTDKLIIQEEYKLSISFNTTKTQLLRYCKKNNIKANQKMTKEEIEKLIIQSQ
jgi:hypothetical protein